ncbi:hypothetical protein BS47DRAFT_1403494 [Hydnum rufescens UP504]|uniref:Uncharacterized protein n=1 Tax=Hydnum rufescens UP504 TaxID=1448309 RepID=A0A9P6AAR3_9AGAM|nr:hypothetical protein BS47DRAFT_1403494 [Hydnum rufescens UP504]
MSVNTWDPPSGLGVQANQAAAPPLVTEETLPSMARFVDVKAEIPVTTVQLDGLELQRACWLDLIWMAHSKY